MQFYPVRSNPEIFEMYPHVHAAEISVLKFQSFLMRIDWNITFVSKVNPQLNLRVSIRIFSDKRSFLRKIERNVSGGKNRIFRIENTWMGRSAMNAPCCQHDWLVTGLTI